MRHVTQQRWHLLWFATCSVTAVAVGLKADQQSPVILCWKILPNDEREKAEDAVDKNGIYTSYVHGSKLVIYFVKGEIKIKKKEFPCVRILKGPTL